MYLLSLDKRHGLEAIDFFVVVSFLWATVLESKTTWIQYACVERNGELDIRMNNYDCNHVKRCIIDIRHAMLISKQIKNSIAEANYCLAARQEKKGLTIYFLFIPTFFC